MDFDDDGEYDYSNDGNNIDVEIGLEGLKTMKIQEIGWRSNMMKTEQRKNRDITYELAKYNEMKYNEIANEFIQCEKRRINTFYTKYWITNFIYS